MAVFKTNYATHNQPPEKGASEVHIKSIKPTCIQLIGWLNSVEMNHKGIFYFSACILSYELLGV